MAWLYLIIASLGEIFGVVFINLLLQRRQKRWLVWLVISFSFGFLFLALAMKDIPLGVAYSIWTGIGATGAVIMGIIFFKEAVSIKRILFLTCIITGAVGLKLFG